MTLRPHDLDPPPRTVCLLRLSAIGDTCHALAALRALQAGWPQTRFTWIIGRLEGSLMTPLLPEIEFITFDKNAMSRELLRLRTRLGMRRFDLLLDMQLSIRASLVSTLVRAPIKLGFDRRRARELQWLFTNAQIAPAASQHVLDSFLGFVRTCGVEPGTPAWNITLPKSAIDYAERIIPGSRPTLVLSPCSSHRLRNWSPERYAAVAAHAIDAHQMRVVLSGGRSSDERDMGAAILRAAPLRAALSASPPLRVVDQIGKDTLPELLALLARSTVLVSPDSGPVHMATMVGLPVIGLYAATNPARAGPYFSRPWCVDRYDAASRQFLGRPAADIPWTTKIERRGVMDLISVSDVTAKLDMLMQQVALRRPEGSANAVDVGTGPSMGTPQAPG